MGSSEHWRFGSVWENPTSMTSTLFNVPRSGKCDQRTDGLTCKNRALWFKTHTGRSSRMRGTQIRWGALRLDRAQVYEKYKGYIDRFNIPVKGRNAA